MQKKTVKGFTLIELLVVMAILSILSGAGVVAYNGYTSAAKETATKANHTKIVNNMESEFAKCKLDKSSKIFDSHGCKSTNRPSTGTINNYVNSLGLKNPYDKTQKVAQSNVCTSGSIAITEKETGSYNVAYASIKKQKKHTSLVSSGWASNYSKTKSTSIAYTCASASSKPKGTFENYKSPTNLPKNGLGAWIEVDKDGNMTSGYSGGMVCDSSYCGSQNAKDKKGRYMWLKPGYKLVLVSPASASGNVSSACAQRACKYNFSDNTYTARGVVYDATTGKPKK